MNLNPNLSRWLTAGLLATTALTFAAPAFAGNGRRYKGAAHASRAQRVVVHDRSSSVAPVLAGMIGGFILGAAITSDAYPVVVHERVHYRRPVVVYRYYDPYADVWFDSLDECDFGGYRNHPRVIHVIETRSGRHVRSVRYKNGGWHRYDDDRGSRYDDDRRSRYDDDRRSRDDD